MKVWFYYAEDENKEIHETEVPDVVILNERTGRKFSSTIVASTSLEALIEARTKAIALAMMFHENEKKKAAIISKALEIIDEME